jgi:hypothetical protein
LEPPTKGKKIEKREKRKFTIEHAILGNCPKEEGECVKVVKLVLFNPIGKFSTSSVKKEVALCTAVKQD